MGFKHLFTTLREWLAPSLKRIDDDTQPAHQSLTWLRCQRFEWGEQLVLRSAVEADFPALVELEAICYDGYIAWSLADFKEDFKQNPYAVYGVLERNGVIIGLISGRFLYRDAHISHLFLTPEERGKGLAQRLVQWWLVQAQAFGAQKVALEVRESNQAALNLYQAQGFQITHRRRNYYYVLGETAICMEYRFDIQNKND